LLAVKYLIDEKMKARKARAVAAEPLLERRVCQPLR
ncbi:electron transport complex subunit RsxE, partial [Serratia sp. CY43514]